MGGISGGAIFFWNGTEFDLSLIWGKKETISMCALPN